MSHNTIATGNRSVSPSDGFNVELEAYQAFQIVPELSQNHQPELAAVIQAASHQNAVYHADSGIAVDNLMIIDMRAVPPSSLPGYKLFGSEYVTAQADYLLIDPKNLDFTKDQGFKALRKGETFVYGRPTEETAIHDKKRRFSDASSATSRNHFEIVVGEKGKLSITDLDSSNGTSVLTGIAANKLMGTGERLAHVLKIANQLGRTALQLEVDNYVSETNTSRASILGPEKAAAVLAKSDDETQPKLTRELLRQYPELAPQGGIHMGNYDFVFSRIVAGEDGRKHAVAYVEDAVGKIVPRLYYKSVSDGGWRCTPGIYDDSKTYSKGEDSSDGGYAQLTKPVEEIAQYLETIEMDGEVAFDRTEFNSLFSLKDQAKEGLDSFDKEIRVKRLDGRKQRVLYSVYQPGIGYIIEASKARKALEAVVLPKAFEPTFDVIDRQYKTNYSLAGKSIVKVFRAELTGRPIEWHMAQSELGDSWVDKIVYKDAGITSYGTYDEVILAGALSTKPYEYLSQLDHMEEPADFKRINSGTYASLQPFWNRLPPIKRFKAAQKYR